MIERDGLPGRNFIVNEFQEIFLGELKIILTVEQLFNYNKDND